MKKSFTYLLTYLFVQTSVAQSSGSITVGGDLSKFYPVTWFDGGWDNNSATTLEIGRSNTHQDANWRGSLNARFDFHVTNWGNGAPFINAQVAQYKWDRTLDPFIAGWQDATGNNNGGRVIIWLKGGGTTYFYKANYSVNPQVFDGTQNALPYVENSVNYTFKNAVEWYVNSYGVSAMETAFYNGAGTNAFLGKVGIGTTFPEHRLHVLSNDYSFKLEGTSAYSGMLFKSAATTKQFGLHYITDGASGLNTNSLRFGRYTNNLSWESNPILFDMDAPDFSLNVSENGNVGLGTSSPEQRLDVAGFAQAKSFVIKNNSDNVFQAVQGIKWYHLIGTYEGWDPKSIYIAGYNAGNNSQLTTEKVYIGNTASDKFLSVNLMDGKVAIGTPNTIDGDYRLYVEKGIRTRKVKVDQAVWADYVLQPGYKLLSIAEVEAHIKKHGQLPGVPATREVEKDGTDVAETQALLLKKVEELTLYIIELKKEIEQLKHK